MSQEQIQCAIDCNNSKGLSPVNISFIQQALCVPQTGVFDAETVVAIGKVSIENRIAPELKTRANAIIRDYYIEKLENSLSEKEKKKIDKLEENINKLESKRNENNTSKIDEKIANNKDKVDLIKAPYLSPVEHEHINKNIDIGSVSEIESRIFDLSNNFSAGDGELDQAVFNTIFQRMVNEKMYFQLIQLSIDYEKMELDKNTIAILYDSESDFNYQVKIPFTPLEVNNVSKSQIISNSPNLLRKIIIGKNAFISYGALISNIRSADNVKVEQNKELNGNITETIDNELTKNQIDAAISNNNFIFSEERSIRVIQAITGAQSSGIFDENTIRSISAYQGSNNNARTDGNLDMNTINCIVTEIINNNEHNAALSIMKDYYSLEATSNNEIILKYSANQTESVKKDNTLPGVEQITFSNSAFSNGLTSLHTSFKEAFGYEKTIEHEMIGTLLSSTDSERQTAMWSNPNTTNQSGLVASIRDNFPDEQDIANYLSRNDISNEDKIAGLGALSVELGRLEFLMGVIYYGGNDKIWETYSPTKNNKGPFVNYYKNKVGNSENGLAWCTMFSGYLKRILGFSNDLSNTATGPNIFNAGLRLDKWATDGTNLLTGVDDFDDPTDYDNYSGNSIDTEDWISLKNDLSVTGLTATQKQETLNSFLNDRFIPQPGDIIVINPQSTATNEPNKYHANDEGYLVESHTMTVETFNSPIITTIEGNKDHKTTGTSLDLSDSSDVIKVLFMTRIGIEFFPQNEQNELETNQNTDLLSLDQMLNPLKIMVRNLQLLADHKGYINSNTENARVYDMGDGTPGGSTN